MTKHFESKVALVTGGNSGIGQAIAIAFAREGARAVIAARRADQSHEVVNKIRELGGDAHFVQTELASATDVKAMVASCINEYAAQGLRINAVCPAIIDTPMLEEAVKQDAGLTAQLKAKHPMGRFGQPEEVAAATLWLCSAGASFVTDHAHPVDGGRLI